MKSKCQWPSEMTAWLMVVGVLSSAPLAIAQNITQDGTLGPAQTLTGPIYLIRQADGTTVGSNLFHSFGRFNLSAGEVANFQSAANIRNILARVTGGSASSIDGLVFTQSSNVNLFLINPSGILFGPNARLDIGSSTRGSFVATTVDAVVWPNGAQFSATTPGRPDSLLTIVGDPSGFLASQRLPQPITVSGSTLRVAEGQSLLLLGGNVTLDNSFLSVDFFQGGRIELGGIAEVGTVGLSINGNEFRLGFSEGITRAGISITNGSSIDVVADSGGSIAINADNLNISNGSRLLAGIGQGLGSANSQAGDITLSATQAIRLEQLSGVQNAVAPNAIGNGGNLIVTGESLFVADGSMLSTVTLGRGNAGMILINTHNNTVFDGTDSNGISSGVISGIGVEADGKGGNIKITAGSLIVRNGAQLIASTLGQGNAGNILINVLDRVVFDGNISGRFSGAASSVAVEAIGNGGNVTIIADSLSVTNGAQLIAATRGRGDAGSVVITAYDDVIFDGAGSNGDPSGAFSSLLSTAEGKGGEVKVTTGALTITNGARLSASTRGRGDAGGVVIDALNEVVVSGVGNDQTSSGIFSQVGTGGEGQGGDIKITAESLLVSDGAQLSVGVFGRGDAGTITIDASRSVLFNGVGSNGDHSGAFSTIEVEATGQGGKINITAGSLSVTDGALLSVLTGGYGNAGSITIDVRESVVLRGIGSDGIPGGVVSNVAGGTGNGGKISITTGSLSISNAAQLQSITFGQGNAGDIVINARNSVFFDGTTSSSNLLGNVFSTVSTGVQPSGIGEGGDINITTRALSITNGFQLGASTSGQGNAGNVQIRASDTVTISGSNLARSSSGIFTVTGSNGLGGDIRIDTGTLRVADGGVLDARTRASGNGGNITGNVNSLEVLNGGQLITTTESSGRAGTITINATDRVTVAGSDATFFNRVAQFPGRVPNKGPTSGFFVLSQGSGGAGDIEVNARLIQLDNQGRFIAESVSGNGGNIVFQVQDLLLMRRGSQISTTAGTAQAGGDGGNIQINVPRGFIVAVPSENSDIIANAFTGRGGRVDITAQGIFGIAFRDRLTPLSDITASSELGVAGVVNLNTPDGDPSRGLVPLPVDLADASRQIVPTCQSSNRQGAGKFFITGRGGLPPNPTESLSREAILTADGQSVESAATGVDRTSFSNRPPDTIVEAQGWTIDGNGNVFLVAWNPQTSAPLLWQPSLICKDHW